MQMLLDFSNRPDYHLHSATLTVRLLLLHLCDAVRSHYPEAGCPVRRMSVTEEEATCPSK